MGLEGKKRKKEKEKKKQKKWIAQVKSRGGQLFLFYV